MTDRQSAALELVERLDATARVIGWDTSVNGPAVAMETLGFHGRLVITPRGQLIDKTKRKVRV
jgi:hypothetical protein